MEVILILHLVNTVYHCPDSIQHCPCASLQDISVHKCKTDIRTDLSIASDDKRHNKSPCVYLQHACITLSAVLRFSSSGDLSYGTLSQSTLWGFITVAYNSEWRNIWMEGENWGEKGKSRKIDPLCFGLRQKHLDEGQRQDCGKERTWSSSKG